MHNFEKLLANSYRFLSYRPRSEKEVRDYLIKKVKTQRTKDKIDLQNDKLIGEVIDSVISKLKQHKFLDDFEFVRWWIDQRSKVKPKALKFIIFELKQKGISKELIEEVLEDEDFQTTSDFDKALDLANKRIKRYINEEPKKRYEKMFRFLASKGFDWDTIKKVVDQVLPKGYNRD